MNEVEEKVKDAFKKLLERDHGVSRQEDRELMDGLWANLDGEDKSFACSSPSTGVRDLVDDATHSQLFCYYMGYKRGKPTAEYVGRPAVGSADSSEQQVFNGLLDGEGQVPDSKLKATTRSRLAALSEYLSRIVATDRSVILFRTRVLGGPTKTLSPAEANQLIQCLLMEQQAGSQHDAETLWWSGNDATPHAEPISVWRGSELWNLQVICNRLAKRYSWAQDQVCYLILTGEPITVNVLRGKVATRRTGVAAHRYNTATITLEVDAWLPSEYVRRAYHDAQRNYRSENNRQPELRNVEVFRFVVAQSDLEILSETEGLAKLIIPRPWKVLRNLWNEQYPKTHEWHYHKKQEHRFSRDFSRGQEAVIGTPYGLPGIPNQPMTEGEVVSRVEQMIERLSQAAGRGATFTPIDE